MIAAAGPQRSDEPQPGTRLVEAKHSYYECLSDASRPVKATTKVAMMIY